MADRPTNSPNARGGGEKLDPAATPRHILGSDDPDEAGLNPGDRHLTYCPDEACDFGKVEARGEGIPVVTRRRGHLSPVADVHHRHDRQVRPAPLEPQRSNALWPRDRPMPRTWMARSRRHLLARRLQLADRPRPRSRRSQPRRFYATANGSGHLT